ncbi:MAG: hypothetical protein WD749_14810, partial [Phycisphaerales bacterium]
MAVRGWMLVGSALIAGCAGSPRGEVAQSTGERKLAPDDALAAARFRYEQRLDERGRPPAGDALMRAVAKRKAMAAQIAGSAGDSVSWQWIGPGNIGGRIRGILIHPADPNIMWTGAATGGVWKTTNGGASWFPLDDFVPALSIGCMAMDPANPNVLYAGTGEGFFETVAGTSNTAAVLG